MQLFLVLYTALGVGGTWGPLPYGYDQCLKHKFDILNQLAEASAKDSVAAQKLSDFRFECEYHSDRPKLRNG